MSVADQRIDPQRYQVVPRTLTFLIRDGRVLLLRLPASAGPWAGRLNGVGGHVEAGESVADAARRELFEETGLMAENLALCGTVIIQALNSPGIALFVFVGDGTGDRADPSEAGEPVWAELTEIPEDLVVEDLPQLLPRALAAFRRQAPPFNGLYAVQEDGSVQITWSE